MALGRRDTAGPDHPGHHDLGDISWPQVQPDAIPLQLTYAITVHNSQGKSAESSIIAAYKLISRPGMTLVRAIIDLGDKQFSSGLSLARSLGSDHCKA